MSLLENVEFTAHYEGETTFPNSGHACDRWYLVMSKRTNPAPNIVFTYHTGLGHRKNGKVQRPKLESVLECLLADAGYANELFKDFCSDLGYDPDSRKALKTYLACQETEIKLRSLFGYGYQDQLREELDL